MGASFRPTPDTTLSAAAMGEGLAAQFCPMASHAIVICRNPDVRASRAHTAAVEFDRWLLM